MILKVEFQEKDSILKVAFAENCTTIQADFGEIFEIDSTEFPYYEGPYSIAPAVSEQVLETARHIMSKDMVIEKIPFYKVSNNKGGETVTIG